MSEYQYYEFQTIDRPLTERERAEIGELSSRVALTPTQAVFTYQFGDFRGDPENVLARYFDAMLYLANWGTRQLLFRFPKSLIDLKQVEPYCVEDSVEFKSSGHTVILDIRFDKEEGIGWVEGEGLLSSLIELRDDILRQDYRALYLAWLKAISLGDMDEETEEPPVPPGLRTLSSALRAFIDLFEIDPHLVSAAAQSSGEEKPISEEALLEAISKLSPEERDDYLLRLVRGEPHLSAEMNVRLRESIAQPERESKPRRTIAQLLADAAQARERERRKREREAEAKRIKAIEALARREEQAWKEVDALIQKSNAKGYQEAIRLLSDLRDVAAHRHTETMFQKRLNWIHQQYRSRHALMDRLRRAGLNPQDE